MRARSKDRIGSDGSHITRRQGSVLVGRGILPSSTGCPYRRSAENANENERAVLPSECHLVIEFGRCRINSLRPVSRPGAPVSRLVHGVRNTSSSTRALAITFTTPDAHPPLVWATVTHGGRSAPEYSPSSRGALHTAVSARPEKSITLFHYAKAEPTRVRTCARCARGSTFP